MPELALRETKNFNLSYLFLTQRQLEKDRPTAITRLGLNNKEADFLLNLSLSDMVKLASSDVLLVRFRFDNKALLAMVADGNKDFDPTPR